MARYYRYRKYSRRYRRRGTWSSNLKNFLGSQSASPNSQYIIYQNLCQNPESTDITVSQKYTIKNVNCSVQLNAPSSTSVQYLDSFQAYIMFVPQGYIPTGTPSAYGNLPFDHPEWILAHKFIGQVLEPQENNKPFRITSRLARKLDSGDRIVLIILGRNTAPLTGSSYQIDYQGLVKFNTKAN